nr:hypothetical protein [Bacilli bacterium]
DVRNDLRVTFFGSEEEAGWHSVKSWYKEESLGQLNLTGTVASWYECGLSSNNIDVEGGTSPLDLANNAMEWYFSSTGDSFSDYDKDNEHNY